MAQLAADPGPLRAYELVMGFAARRGEAALRLAMHAALPQVLRVELLHLIRLNFLPEAAYDLAIEADVLFAPFCEDIGNGYYCFARNARLQLLQELDPAYREEATPRSGQVARFMLDFLDHEQRDVRTGSDRLRCDWIEVERWSALAFAEPALAAGQLAAALARATASDDIAARVRVGGLASALATPLARFGDLLAYAEGVEALQAGRAGDAGRLFGGMPDREIEIAGIRLKSPRRVLAENMERQAPEVPAREPPDQAETPVAAPGEQAEAKEAPIEQVAPVRDQIHISYSARDRTWCELLKTQLKPVTGALGLSVSSDLDLGPGEAWEEQITNALGRARLAIVLVSADYLASDDLMERELPRLVELARSGELSLTWLCVRSCVWSSSPLVEFQAAHDPHAALEELPRGRRDRALVEIARKVNELLRADLGMRRKGLGAAPNPPRRGSIFIVYRRDDATGYAIRLQGSLQARFGDPVFIDLGDIQFGADFPATIQSVIGEAGAVIALIGPNWLDSRDPDGRRRIDSDEDWVRIELAEALRHGIPVIPVLVGGAGMPRGDMLPEDVARLAYLNEVELRDSNWDRDCTRLAGDLERISPDLHEVRSGAQIEERVGPRPLRIYLSSTVADLARERDAVVDSLRRLGHLVVSAESYAALDQRPLDKAYADIAACDVFVCIVAWRYGFVPADSAGNPERRSIVELEYRRALALGKPTLVFMLAEDAPWDPRAMDATTGEGEKGERILAFRRELMTQHLVGTYRSVDDLAVSVVSAISGLKRSASTAGEARPDSGMASEDKLHRQDTPATTGGAAPAMQILAGGTWIPGPSSAERLQPGTVFRDCEACPEMVVIPAGGFTMGSPDNELGHINDEGPQHDVTIARPFAVGRFAVTFDEWDACVAAGGCSHKPDDNRWGRGRRPVINVSWVDAQQYVRWLSQKTGREYRLLSEAEWEYAARAGSTTRYPWGDEPGRNLANFRDSGSEWSGRQTAPVGSFQPNAFGLYDMTGNVLEWTQDCWYGSYWGAPADGRPWESGGSGRRVVRGGSWIYDPEFCRSANRFRFEPGDRYNILGFRLARTL